MLETGQTLQPSTLFDGHYRLLRPLSTDGATADVWLAVDINTIDTSMDDEYGESTKEDSGMLVAIKIYRPKNALDVEGEQRFREEFKIVYECRHENLLQPTSFAVCDGIPYLVLPYCKNGSSEQLINKQLSLDDIWKFILDVSSGLNRLHTNETPIIHQDIKPANVLIDNNGDYAITDFGISAKRGGEHGFYYDDENSGTMAYMAPERFLEDSTPMSQSDIWAFGATLYEILSGKVPFGEDGGKSQTENPNQLIPIANIPSDIQHLIADCLAFEPGNRPSAKTIKEAALAKRYPLRPRKGLYWTLGIALAAVIALGVYYLVKPSSPIKPLSIEQQYQLALSDISSSDPDSVLRGVARMDSLSNLRYIPAIYQMAYTYGWYVEKASMKRKQLLGIETFDADRPLGYLPKNDRYTNEAFALLSKILELNDSAYAEINAQAAYRLACYYVNPNQIIKPNTEKGLYYLKQSRIWAELSRDTLLLQDIDNSLKNIKKAI